ncbi:MAG: hypothetical protein N3B21_16165 [Clostridia bacterium]|nr:hypothetical protein [Clostridia bacterium]
MFYQVRYQTGEINDVIEEMKQGQIPCMDVDNKEELNWVVSELSKNGIYKIENLAYDKDARDRIKEPEFEFRIGFYNSPVSANDVDTNAIMYIDFYFAPDEEETYDSIFGD